jgi:hypothetical protein
VEDFASIAIGEFMLVRFPGGEIIFDDFANGMLFKLMTFLFSMLPIILSDCKEDEVMISDDIEDATSLLVRTLVELEFAVGVEELDGCRLLDGKGVSTCGDGLLAISRSITVCVYKCKGKLLRKSQFGKSFTHLKIANRSDRSTYSLTSPSSSTPRSSTTREWIRFGN